MNHELTTMAYKNVAISLSEYLLVAMPDEKFVNSLGAFQQNLTREGYPGAGLLPVRYLTLARLMAKDYLEDTLSRWIMKVCRIKPSFLLSFEKDLKYKEGVVSLQVADSPELRSFFLQLDVVADFLNASECPPLQLISNPQFPVLIHERTHVPVERQLSFNENFRITEIAMLKRNEFHDRFERINLFGLAV